MVKQLFHKSKLTGPELDDFRKEMDIIMYVGLLPSLLAPSSSQVA